MDHPTHTHIHVVLYLQAGTHLLEGLQEVEEQPVGLRTTEEQLVGMQEAKEQPVYSQTTEEHPTGLQWFPMHPPLVVLGWKKV
ncbi:hypothetical protein E3N88_22676 [Mikania micrantha]|uniref:Uncharacterized protein n=1 Tax=Mikania micrantha TaxID=192012 RepID=A0A5N6NDS6_9ASTR|nr:hypothetical protein E3N88_22676 [Mikania micrantha]